MAVDYEEGRRLLAEKKAAEKAFDTAEAPSDEQYNELNAAQGAFNNWLRWHAEALLNPDPWRPISEAPKDVLIDIWIDNGSGSGVRWAGCHYDQICDQWRQNTPGHSVKWVPAKAVTHFCLPPDPPTHFRELKGPGHV